MASSSNGEFFPRAQSAFLLLRLPMCQTKVDPLLAQTTKKSRDADEFYRSYTDEPHASRRKVGLLTGGEAHRAQHVADCPDARVSPLPPLAPRATCRP